MTAQVSAVIPTTGRPELRRAVESVRAQRVPTEAIVVNDRPALSGQIAVMLNGLPYTLIETAGGRGGAAARQRGVEAASADTVAFLDDDDAWHEDKSERQLEALDAHGEAVMTCLTLFTEAGGGTRVLPERPYDGVTPIADYLWDRSTLRLRRCFLQTSSLMAPRATLLRVPWNESLPRHQDWDLLIRLQRDGVPIRTVPEVLVTVYQGSAGSISRAGDWRQSLAWAEQVAPEASRRARGDFVASIVLRSALRARDLRGVGHAMRRSARLHPHTAAVAVGLRGLVG